MNTLIRNLRQQRGLVLTLYSGFVLPVLTNLFSSWLEQTFGRTPAQLIQLLALVLSLAIATWVLWVALRTPKPQWRLITQEEQPAQHYRGLIALVGPGQAGRDPLNIAAKAAIEYHLNPDASGQHLEICWLVTSAAGVPVAEELRRQYEGRCRVMVQRIANEFDIHDTYQAVLQIFQEQVPAAGLTTEQVIADFTGGTRLMTVGMALACQGRWAMQYTTGKEGALSVPKLVHFTSPSATEE